MYFFLTCSTAEFHWTEIVKVAAQQYGDTLIDEDMD